MNCPVCKNNLTQMKLAEILVDVCDRGCGGIWFDKHELKKIRSKLAPRQKTDDHITVEVIKKISACDIEQIACPVCNPQKLLRRYSSIKQKIFVDECPSCAGTWLDHNELNEIHNEFESLEDQQRQSEEFVNQVAKNKLPKPKASKLPISKEGRQPIFFNDIVRFFEVVERYF